MFPFFSPDTDIQAIVNAIIALCRMIYAAAPIVHSDPLFGEVLGLRSFAGAIWQDTTTGLAQGWAIVVDNLLDIALKILHLDPQDIRGDH
jgi:hypothetical protein